MESSQFFSHIQKARLIPHSLVLEHVSPATRLLEKRRQMFEVQEALDLQKLEFSKKEEVLKRREEGLKRKDIELQESLIRFSKFLQESDSKRSRALKKASDERKACEEKEKEVDQLLHLVEDLRSQKEEAQAILKSNIKYQHYLESVLEVTPECHEINDLIARHATLEASNQDLREQQRQAGESTEQVRAELRAYTKARTDEILHLNTSIAALKKQLEASEQEAYALESKKDQQLQAATRKTLTYGQVCMSTDNLFSRCRQKSSVARSDEKNALRQLDIIGNFISDLEAMKDLHHPGHKVAAVS
ncbi:hypothetical protein WJX74_009370 [Apatococcus lobatus]|uniref:DUF4200 domain-containing protein n=1 Tax=Apatococcus lobatus TaxID=904363 RepID=A0AAW1RHQ7_9CHLO